MKRVILIVLDSLGVGALPDAQSYGDKGTNTLGHIIEKNPEMDIPNLIKLGLVHTLEPGFVLPEKMVVDSSEILGSYGRLGEMSKGKDTITGHWEIAGLFTEVPFKTYPDGFPPEFMESYEKAIGVETLGNYAASGTEIIEALGPEHEASGKPIIYTSADSVFQIAANTAVIPLERLYEICQIARELLVGEYACGRVIARPYVLENGKRNRTSDRKDYAVSPTGKTILDHLTESGKTVCAIGKIHDIFNGQGIKTSIHTDNNMDGVDKTLTVMNQEFEGLIFTNLVDFDSKYGHRRDPEGYARCLEEFDRRLPEILKTMKEEDILILCADHGNDPTHTGWDHTREYVPVLVYGKSIQGANPMETGASYGDMGATIAEILGVRKTDIGNSFYKQIQK